MASTTDELLTNEDPRQFVLSFIEYNCLFVVTIIVGARLYWCRFVVHNFKVEDWTILFAWVFAVTTVIVSILATRSRWEFHIDTLPKTAGLVKIAWLFNFFHELSISLVKISILLYYKRLSAVNVFRKLIAVGTVFVIFWLAMNWITSFLQCNGPSFPFHAPGTPMTDVFCVPLNPEFSVFGALNAFTDFYVLILPIPFIWKKEMPEAVKLQTIGVFFTGAIACVAGVNRLIFYYIHSINNLSIGSNVYLWSIIEITLGTLCACAPFMHEIWFAFRQRSKHRFSSSRQLDWDEEHAAFGGGGGGRETPAGVADQRIKQPETAHIPHRPLGTVGVRNGRMQWARGKKVEGAPAENLETVVQGRRVGDTWVISDEHGNIISRTKEVEFAEGMVEKADGYGRAF